MGGLGDEADAWRDQNRGGWDALLPHFVAAVEKGADRWRQGARTTRGC